MYLLLLLLLLLPMMLVCVCVSGRGMPAGSYRATGGGVRVVRVNAQRARHAKRIIICNTGKSSGCGRKRVIE